METHGDPREGPTWQSVCTERIYGKWPLNHTATSYKAAYLSNLAIRKGYHLKRTSFEQ